jgi:hypothetical protein
MTASLFEQANRQTRGYYLELSILPKDCESNGCAWRGLPAGSQEALPKKVGKLHFNVFAFSLTRVEKHFKDTHTKHALSTNTLSTL